MRAMFLLAGAGLMLAFGAPAAADAQPGKAKGNQGQVVKAKPGKANPARVNPALTKSRAWQTGCPPGLIWRGPACVPPGQAKKLLGVGTRVPQGWSYTPWGAVPANLRTQYDLDPNLRYIHRDNVIYVVDPQTRLITNILDAVL